jgi:ABC-type bacteriocin/lantibiotic exporter with double-glycine peptidase domain
MKKYIYGFVVFVLGMLFSTMVGDNVLVDAGSELRTEISKVLLSINLLSAIVVVCTLFIVEEMRKK